MKHSIIIYHDLSKASKRALSEIQAGIEEEGIKSEVFAYSENSCNAADIENQEILQKVLASNAKYTNKIKDNAREFAKAAAKESAFGCGIGVSNGHASLWLLSHGMSILDSENTEKKEIMRRIGHNAGRAIKKLSFL